jgi:hypothetical protein
MQALRFHAAKAVQCWQQASLSGSCRSGRTAGCPAHWHLGSCRCFELVGADPRPSCVQMSAAAAGDWGGWTPTAHTLLYWCKWLNNNLAHNDKSMWSAIFMRFYATADPLATAVAVALLCAAFCFVASLPTNNHSFVSRGPVPAVVALMLRQRAANNRWPVCRLTSCGPLCPSTTSGTLRCTTG